MIKNTEPLTCGHKKLPNPSKFGAFTFASASSSGDTKAHEIRQFFIPQLVSTQLKKTTFEDKYKQMTSETENWRNAWLNSINELTSHELQKKSWLISTPTNPHWSFIEFMCSYFDDLAIGDDYKIPLQDNVISTNEYEIIKDWHEALSKYDSPKNEDYNNEAILNDQKWIAILHLGFKTRNVLADTLNENERRILTDEIDYLKFL